MLGFSVLVRKEGDAGEKVWAAKVLAQFRCFVKIDTEGVQLPPLQY